MSKNLIGLVGRARTGKDTAGGWISCRHGLRTRSFADPIKMMLMWTFGDRFSRGDREQPIDWLGKSPRQLMQTLGTEWGRDLVHPDLWVLVAKQEWERLLAEGGSEDTGMVFTDVRFRNEAEWVLREGGTLIHIVRPDAELVNAHASEQADLSDLCDYRIENTGTIEDLYTQVDGVMALINGG